MFVRLFLGVLVLGVVFLLLAGGPESAQALAEGVLPWVLLGISIAWGLLGVVVGLGWLKPGYWSGFSPLGNVCMSAGLLAFFVPPFFTGTASSPRAGPLWERALFFAGAGLLLFGVLLSRRARLRQQRASEVPG